ncbi:restriction endonuclease [candidate division WOR-3 bacterium]|nr:restriction endonuclease [candidate division WOR-3 bacterium]
MGRLDLDKNYLIFGDNLDVLREYIQDESIDLIYLDPPFKSGKDYNILFEESNGTKSETQIRAFEDTWQWTITSEETYKEIVEKSSNPKLIDLIVAMKERILGTNDMMAYLVMMAIRLQELYRVLKPTGSIYLHCDPSASHYLKLVMDTIFKPTNFRNEIVWHYRTGNIAHKQFQRKHDVIFFYSKTHKNIFKPQEIKEYYFQLYGPQFKPSFKGRKHGKDKYGEYRISFVDDVWDISAVFTLSKEHLDYPTQKPEKLLERIIKASSNEGDVVLDPFCGCGTTVVAAEKLNRKWIGIDITSLAVDVMENRLKDAFGRSVSYEVKGIPKSVKDAEDLAQRDRLRFQEWAVRRIPGAMPAPRGVADRGIDGTISFLDPETRKANRIIVQVKSGTVNPAVIRDLRGVIEREKAEMGVLITLKEPTKGMKTEAASAGFYKSPAGEDYPKLQILKVEELLAGYTIKYPPLTKKRIFKKARKIRDTELTMRAEQEEMFRKEKQAKLFKKKNPS